MSWLAGRGVPVAVRVFAGRADQSREARRWVRALLDAAGPVEDAVLAASELFANAVVHTRSGRPGGSVTVAITGDGTVHVHDLGCGARWGAPPGLVVRSGDVLGPGRRGLPVVAAVCAGWGTVPADRCAAGGMGDPAVTAGGRCVWCRLPLLGVDVAGRGEGAGG